MRAMVDHDGRALSRMEPHSREVHLRLEAWGRWAHEGNGAWPSITPIGRMMEYGPLGAAQPGKPPITMPEEIAVTDAAVARLCVIDRRAIVAYYTREEPIEACAKRIRMSVRHFQRVLWRARHRLAGHLQTSGAQLAHISCSVA